MSIDIDNEGFLSPDIEEYRRRFRTLHAVYFDWVDRLNRFCHEVKFKVQPHNRDGQEIFATGLFVKALADVEAAVIVLERGLISQADSLLRVGLEALINLGKVCQSYEFVQAFIKVGERQRLKLVRAMRNNPAPGFDVVRDELTDELIDRIAEVVGDAKEEKVDQWARDVGLSALYDGQYRLFSIDVHSRPRCLERYVIMNETGELIDVAWGPELKDNLQPELVEAGRLLIASLSFIDRLFNLSLGEQIQKFTAELAELDRIAHQATH